MLVYNDLHRFKNWRNGGMWVHARITWRIWVYYRHLPRSWCKWEKEISGTSGGIPTIIYLNWQMRDWRLINSGIPYTHHLLTKKCVTYINVPMFQASLVAMDSIRTMRIEHLHGSMDPSDPARICWARTKHKKVWWSKCVTHARIPGHPRTSDPLTEACEREKGWIVGLWFFFPIWFEFV